MSLLVDWMSRHGWKLLAALIAIELLFRASVMGAQESAASGGGRLRVEPGDQITALGCVQFDVMPIPE